MREDKSPDGCTAPELVERERESEKRGRAERSNGEADARASAERAKDDERPTDPTRRMADVRAIAFRIAAGDSHEPIAGSALGVGCGTGCGRGRASARGVG